MSVTVETLSDEDEALSGAMYMHSSDIQCVLFDYSVVLTAEESSLEQPTTPHPKSTLPRWKRRTEQQIEANKLAQKRYR